ncbi:MAG: hypothetical protein AMJ78_00670 [Omnitrophica WOR_2 bacterium SM23_29]|nr:MAG: hypothetical protein AMJ78_00670 [Omnitrophica WOR_2 bacterium SM23_29]
MRRIWKNVEVEDKAEERLSIFERKFGEITKPPILIDDIIEDAGLKILWDVIEERRGEIILGGLRLKERLIVLNESHFNLFKGKPGLLRSTKGHELGHWDLYVDKAKLDHPLLPGFEDESIFQQRNAKNGLVEVISNAWLDDDVYKVYQSYTKRKDHPYEASAVERYASAISMPKRIILACIKGIDLTAWRNLYELAEDFDVTISALCVRLQRLGLIFITDDKKIYKSKERYQGQGIFKF